MLLKLSFAFFLSVIVVGYECAYVDKLQKCKLNDYECLRKLYQTIISDIGKTGIPSLNIPPIDPIKLQNMSFPILGIMNITLLEGVAKGVKDCIFNKFFINIEEERGTQENTCDLIIKGHYQLESFSPLIRNLLGGDVHGDGNVKVKISQMHLKFDFPFYAQKRDDGEIYIKCLYDDIKYDFEVRGKTIFFADNLYVGEQEVSELIVSMMNDNWQFVMSTFGQPFVDKAVRLYFKFAGNFFDVVPARHFIIDDLTPYAKP